MFVTVGGEVKKPGQLQINESAQLYAVIQSAGGPNEFGSMKKVKIIREGRTIEVNLEDDSQKTADDQDTSHASSVVRRLMPRPG